jgi:DNA-binding beta-propeller fold protein YncE
MRVVPLCAVLLCACARGAAPTATPSPPAASSAPAAPPPVVLVASKKDAEVRLVDAAVAEVLATLPTGAGPHEIAVAPDGRVAVVANGHRRSQEL